MKFIASIPIHSCINGKDYPLGDVGVHHEVVNVLLCSAQFQFPGDHRHHKDGAAGSL